MKLVLGSLIGMVLVLLGLVVLPLPIPFGAVMIVGGLALMVWANPWIARWIRRWRRNSTRFDAAIGKVARFLPKWLQRRLGER